MTRDVQRVDRAARVRIIAIGTLLAGFLAVGAPSLVFPFGRDQGSYGYAAHRMLEGDTLYRDIYAFKPPATALVHALALASFGHSMHAIRVLDLLWTLGTCLVIFAFARRLFQDDIPAVLVAVAYAWLYYRLGFWHTAQTDGWTVLPVAGAFLLQLGSFQREEGWSRRSVLVAGAQGCLVGIAFLFKYTQIAFLLVFAAAEAMRLRAIKPTVVSWAAGAAGFAAPILVAIVVMQACGAWSAFLAVQTDVLFPYSLYTASWGTGLPLSEQLLRLYYGLSPQATPGLVLILIGVGVVMSLVAQRAKRWAEPRQLRVGLVLTLVWVAYAVVTVYSQGKFFPYHYVPVLPGLAVLAVAALYLPVSRHRRWRYGRVAVISGAVGLVGLMLLHPVSRSQWMALASIINGNQSVGEFWSRSVFHRKDQSLRECMALARYIREQTKPREKIFIWGYDPIIYFLAERDLVSRFLYHFPISIPWAPPGLEAELMRDLRETPPALVVVASDDRAPWDRKDSTEMLANHPALLELIRNEYRQRLRIGRYYVYHQRAAER